MRSLGFVAALVMVLIVAGAAVAAAQQPAWRIDSVSNTTGTPGGTFDYIVQPTNVGDADADGTSDPIVFTAALPHGVRAQSVNSNGINLDCSANAFPTETLTCTDTTDLILDSVDAVFGGANFISIQITASVDGGVAAHGTAAFQVSGGNGGSASTVDPTTFTTATPRFGIDAFDAGIHSGAAGDPMTQAGGHPFDITTPMDFNTTRNPNPMLGDLWPVEATRDAIADLPPGLIGDPSGLSQCTAAQLANSQFINAMPLCPATSQVGTALIRINGAPAQTVYGPLPVFEMVPPPNAPARFGVNVLGVMVVLDASLRSDSDYGLVVSGKNLSEGLPVAGASFTFWGVPSDTSHDSQRACPGQQSPSIGGPTCPSGAPRRAFLRNPTSCVADPITLHVDSWVHPGAVRADGSPDLTDPNWMSASVSPHAGPGYPAPPSDWGPTLAIDHCEKVPFTPRLSETPGAGVRAGEPSGFTFDLDLPQNDDPASIGEGDLKTTTVTLPEGVRISPSSAAGLGACSPAQIGLLGTNFPAPNPIHFSDADAACPDSSKIGEVSIKTPLLADPVTGSIYLATPHDNPFGSLVAIYVVAKGPGVIVKAAGRIQPDPSNGRITAVFDNLPQLPFTNLHLVFDDGPHASLVLPPRCGTFTTDAVLSSWSGATVDSKSSFTLSQGSDGATCPPSKFAPGFSAGTQNPVAGAFTLFSLQLTRTDNDNEFGALSSLALPPGLLANVGSVSTRCTSEQADTHSCPTASHIGEVMAGAGAGSDPFYVPGDVYLTGPYKGNPFGVAVIVHAQAGPFDLGYVVVKGAIQIHDDGSVTVATDPFPTILQGIPLQVRDIRVNLDRPGFMFNPTNCNPLSINGTVLSTENQQAGVASRFQVGECATLAFNPRFSASTQGNGTFNHNGASFDVKLASGEGPGSHEANIRKVEVQLPKALPARLTTLQKACTEQQFATNPAGCPAASDVGTVTARTPILNAPLQGPAYLVSHGGAAFPDLVLVLQGEGIVLHVTGHTQIKKGITYSRFETVPDAPISSFELKLPEGPFSALAANANLCRTTTTKTVRKRVTVRVHGRSIKRTRSVKSTVTAPLSMPTTITAQNGAVLKQATKIAVTGCAAVKKTAKKVKKARKGGKK